MRAEIAMIGDEVEIDIQKRVRVERRSQILHVTRKKKSN